jgi:uncharacterized protein (DUF169 family)
MTDFQHKVDQWIDILDNLNLEKPPVAVKFLIRKPQGIDKLEQNVFFCEMLGIAQEGKAFYADSTNHMCDAGAYLTGGKDVLPPYTNGEYGAGLKVFNEPRAARRIYEFIPKLAKGTAHYIAFSPLDKLSFEPDLLILVGNAENTEILLRAMSYKTGKMWSSKYSSVMGCAWIFLYPYLTGELNYCLTGLSFGMKAKKVLPTGLQIISIPYDLLPTMLENLKEMPWVLPFFQADGPEFRKRLRTELGLDPTH